MTCIMKIRKHGADEKDEQLGKTYKDRLCLTSSVQSLRGNIKEKNLPITMVSSGISSIKHFFSVSPIWKYRPLAKCTVKKIASKDLTQ